MTNKRKKLARALSEKTGMSHQAAINVLSPPRDPEGPTAERSLQQLLAALRATTTFGVNTGRCPAGGRSASLEKAIAQAKALASAPVYFAESVDVSLIVTLNESRTLVLAGAAERGAIQVIHAFVIGKDHTLSEQCDACRAWIWCFRRGDEEQVEGTCECGHRYRIAFDGKIDWNRNLDLKCTRCGTEHRMSRRNENLNPWRHLNERQVICNRCANGDPKAELSEMLLRTKMVAGNSPETDDRLLWHNSEIGRFHTELRALVQEADAGKAVPEDVLRRLRDEGARLDAQRMQLLGRLGP